MTRFLLPLLALCASGCSAAIAQSEPYTPTCQTVSANEPFAPAAERWMRTQQAAGARSFGFSGQAICAW